MRKITKILATAVMSATMVCTAMFAGCAKVTNGVDGKDGKDGQNVSIYEIYDATNAARAEEGLDQLTFLEFINEYLNYSGDDISQMASMQTTINNALLSGVSLITKFTVITKTYNAFLHSYQETKEEASYAGSGVIIDVDTEKGDMTVITNCHVVYDANGEGDGYCDNISMYLYGGEYNDNNKISAEIIGTCKAFDLAVLKVTDCDLVKGNTSIKAAEWYDGEEVYLGGTVFAVGNPEGDKMSVTMGVVSKDSEYITIDLEDTTDTSDDLSFRVLRTDAAINGGNSGGALYNSDGKIIGIVNAKSVSEDIDNVGYALPAATCKRVIKNILDAYQGTETHGINRAMIGVTTTINSASAVYNTTLNVTDIVENVYVVSVTAGSKFGSVLQANDVLKEIKVTDADGNVKEELVINRQHNSIDAMLSVRAGDTVTLVINRSQEEMTFSQTYSAADLTFYE